MPFKTEKVPPAASIRFQASAGPGRPIVVDKTVAIPTDGGFDPSLITTLPFADGAFRLDITVRLVDGRTITQRVDHGPRPAPAPNDCRVG